MRCWRELDSAQLEQARNGLDTCSEGLTCACQCSVEALVLPPVCLPAAGRLQSLEQERTMGDSQALLFQYANEGKDSGLQVSGDLCALAG